MPHDKPHENGVVLRTPKDPDEVEGAWLHAATPEEARGRYERLLLTVVNGYSEVDLVIGGRIVASSDST
jgi:hypothetical protein